MAMATSMSLNLIGAFKGLSLSSTLSFLRGDLNLSPKTSFTVTLPMQNFQAPIPLRLSLRIRKELVVLRTVVILLVKDSASRSTVTKSLNLAPLLFVNVALSYSQNGVPSNIAPRYWVFQIGMLSTGDSLDMSTQDESLIIANDATLKDMEGAAVAYVADLLKVPVVFLKAVTDLVDGDKPTAEEFLQHLTVVTNALEETATRVINFINAKQNQNHHQ